MFFKRIRNEIIYLRAALRTLSRIGAIYSHPNRTYIDIIEEFARNRPDSVAIYFEDRTLTYGEFNAAANRYARWALTQGIGKGDVVALMMENRPEYLVAWLGILKVGAAAALINTNLVKAPLGHSLNISFAHHLILGAELADSQASALDYLDRPMQVWATGGPVRSAQNLDAALAQQSEENLPADTRKDLTLDDNALFIYTSGTTGNPKAARIPHARVLTIMNGFSAASNAKASDRMYVVMPLYHSAGGVLAVGTVLTVGGSVIIKQRFSARDFFGDCVKYKATLFQYIGELCRYLLNSDPQPAERKHHIRMAIGNGLRPEIWPAFQKRFRVPRILEFYGATEGNVALINYDGTVGAVGRIPKWAKKRFNVEVIRFDLEKQEIARGPDGFCIKCAPGEAGEAVGKITNDPTTPTGRFDGYAEKQESEKKIVRDVFEKGDAWFRTGDLLRQDKLGYFYFVDRIGDTFRWKGENVSTNEVAEVISVFPGIKEVNVYGVHVPGTDGRAGMAAISADADLLDLERLRKYMDLQLPEYARPLFIRLSAEIDHTGTFKQRKMDLVREGFDPKQIDDPIFFNSPVDRKFVPVDAALFDKICSGVIRL